jgi:hypothetical protein
MVAENVDALKLQASSSRSSCRNVIGCWGRMLSKHKGKKKPNHCCTALSRAIIIHFPGIHQQTSTSSGDFFV